jgi:hypothetical protein
MSLVISADGQKLAAQKGTPWWTSAPEFTVAVWAKITAAQWGNLFGACDFANSSYNVLPLRTAAGTTYDHGLRIKNNETRMDGAGLVSGGWDLVVVTYKQGDKRVAYLNGAVAITTTAGVTDQWEWGVGFDYVCFGTMPFDGSNSRSKTAHGAVWNKALTAAEVASLYNGGTAGAGKNPTAVQNANLVFYAPLTSDALVSVGGVTLTATGSPTFDSADNPNVEAAGSGSTNASAPGGEGIGTGSGSGGDATGDSGTNATAPGGTGTGTGSGSGGDATGNTAGSASFTTDKIGNNTGLQLPAGTVIYWEWRAGNIGAAPTSVTYGPPGGVTLGAGGTLTLTGLPAGAGEMLARDDSGGRWIQTGVAA